nr:MAG TPA: hypothetical protein [Caudoviricetes sp.]
MAFTPKTWVGRSVQYPGRIRLVPTGEDGVFDVQRAEGEITADGDLVSDAALNDLEQRILTAILSKADGTGGAANNALALGGVAAGNFAQVSSGNFTPYFYGADTAGSPTYTLQDGSYYKIGQLVIVRIMLRISAKGGMAGRLLIGGWPFAPRGGGDGPIVLNDTTGFSLSGYNVLGGMITQSGGYFTKSSATVATVMTADDISDNLSMWGPATGYYLADN